MTSKTFKVQLQEQTSHGLRVLEKDNVKFAFENSSVYFVFVLYYKTIGQTRTYEGVNNIRMQFMNEGKYIHQARNVNMHIIFSIHIPLL